MMRLPVGDQPTATGQRRADPPQLDSGEQCTIDREREIQKLRSLIEAAHRGPIYQPSNQCSLTESILGMMQDSGVDSIFSLHWSLLFADQRQLDRHFPRLTTSFLRTLADKLASTTPGSVHRLLELIHDDCAVAGEAEVPLPTGTGRASPIGWHSPEPVFLRHVRKHLEGCLAVSRYGPQTTFPLRFNTVRDPNSMRINVSGAEDGFRTLGEHYAAVRQHASLQPALSSTSELLDLRSTRPSCTFRVSHPLLPAPCPTPLLPQCFAVPSPLRERLLVSCDQPQGDHMWLLPQHVELLPLAAATDLPPGLWRPPQLWPSEDGRREVD